MTKTIDPNASARMPLAYVFTPSDNTGTQLISCKLNGKNYNTWSQAMQTALRAKNKLGFIEGKVVQPAEGEPICEHWETCNLMLVTWLFNHLSEDLQTSVGGAKNVEALWDDLKERFSQAKSLLGGNSNFNPNNNDSKPRGRPYCAEMVITRPRAVNCMDCLSQISRTRRGRKAVFLANSDQEEQAKARVEVIGFGYHIFFSRYSDSTLGLRPELEEPIEFGLVGGWTRIRVTVRIRILGGALWRVGEDHQERELEGESEMERSLWRVGDESERREKLTEKESSKESRGREREREHMEI
ncbi:hypothetical protein CRG98_037468 [Punica granatum]|uniref:Retrotransposon Copia-like N-terminal domain-containing protein n=1 Tax=Punica granatum TaxID=22663 RepID=A0A2I0IDT4_PUNGR|nr:hypothetical protein CRG98_037468 [Punica granatum]